MDNLGTLSPYTEKSNINAWDTTELTAGKVRFGPRTQEGQLPVAPSLTETWALCSFFFAHLLFLAVRPSQKLPEVSHI